MCLVFVGLNRARQRHRQDQNWFPLQVFIQELTLWRRLRLNCRQDIQRLLFSVQFTDDHVDVGPPICLSKNFCNFNFFCVQCSESFHFFGAINNDAGLLPMRHKSFCFFVCVFVCPVGCRDVCGEVAEVIT